MAYEKAEPTGDFLMSNTVKSNKLLNGARLSHERQERPLSHIGGDMRRYDELYRTPKRLFPFDKTAITGFALADGAPDGDGPPHPPPPAAPVAAVFSAIAA